MFSFSIPIQVPIPVSSPLSLPLSIPTALDAFSPFHMLKWAQHARWCGTNRHLNLRALCVGALPPPLRQAPNLCKYEPRMGRNEKQQHFTISLSVHLQCLSDPRYVQGRFFFASESFPPRTCEWCGSC